MKDNIVLLIFLQPDPSSHPLDPLDDRIDTDKSGTWPPKYCKVDMELSDGTRVAFSDSRRFARVRWVAAPRGDNGPLGRMAPDALTDMPDLDEFRATLRSRFGSRKSLKVKTLLLDQVWGSGLGLFTVGAQVWGCSIIASVA